METLQQLPPHLLRFAVDVFRLGIWLLVLMVVFVPLERLFAVHPQKVFRKSFAVDLGYYFLNSLVPKMLLVAPMALLAWGLHYVVPGGLRSAAAGMPLGARLAAALVAGEFGFYWGHRWSHEIPLLWRFHSIHHGPENMHWLISTRAHPVDMVFTRLCGLTLLYMTGLAAPMSGSATMIPLLVVLLGTVWGFFIHANLNWRFGPLEL